MEAHYPAMEEQANTVGLVNTVESVEVVNHTVAALTKIMAVVVFLNTVAALTKTAAVVEVIMAAVSDKVQLRRLTLHTVKKMVEHLQAWAHTNTQVLNNHPSQSLSGALHKRQKHLSQSHQHQVMLVQFNRSPVNSHSQATNNHNTQIQHIREPIIQTLLISHLQVVHGAPRLGRLSRHLPKSSKFKINKLLKNGRLKVSRVTIMAQIMTINPKNKTHKKL